MTDGEDQGPKPKRVSPRRRRPPVRRDIAPKEPASEISSIAPQAPKPVQRPKSIKPGPPQPSRAGAQPPKTSPAPQNQGPSSGYRDSFFKDINGAKFDKKQADFIQKVYDRHQIEYLEKRININFKNKTLLVSALTHPSFIGDYPDAGFDHYQRLEFLGDSVLSLYLANLLFIRYPGFSEGPITRIKSSVEQDAELGNVANDLALGRFLVLGRSEMLTGGMTKVSILAASTEALIGAIYIDQGETLTWQFLDRFIGPRVPKEILESEIGSDAKSKLQDILQKRFKSSPVYRVEGSHGPEHDRQYTILVEHRQKKLGMGVGRSKKEAEQEAARDTLARFMDYLQGPTD